MPSPYGEGFLFTGCYELTASALEWKTLFFYNDCAIYFKCNACELSEQRASEKIKSLRPLTPDTTQDQISIWIRSFEVIGMISIYKIPCYHYSINNVYITLRYVLLFVNVIKNNSGNEYILIIVFIIYYVREISLVSNQIRAHLPPPGTQAS